MLQKPHPSMHCKACAASVCTAGVLDLDKASSRGTAPAAMKAFLPAEPRMLDSTQCLLLAFAELAGLTSSMQQPEALRLLQLLHPSCAESQSQEDLQHLMLHLHNWLV